MKMNYAFLLAKTKVRTRLGRSILAVFAAAIVGAVVLLASLVTTGLSRTVSDLGVKKVVEKNLALHTISKYNITTNESAATSVETFSAIAKAEGATEVFSDIAYGNYAVIDPKPANQYAQQGSYGYVGESNQIIGRDDAFFNLYFTDQEYLPVEGTIPLFISQSYLEYLSGKGPKAGEKAAESVTRIQDAMKEWRGKVVTLQEELYDPAKQAQEKKQVKATIVGFTASAGLFNQDMTNFFTKKSVAEKLGLLETEPSYRTFFASFPTKEMRDAYVVKYTPDYTVQPPEVDGFVTSQYARSYGDPLSYLEEILREVRQVGLWFLVALFIATAIAMFTTISKVIADSVRETGVFRAIGAKNSNIYHIYFTYASLIAVLATIVAFCIALAMAVYVNYRYGFEFSTQVMNITRDSSVERTISFIGVNPLHILTVFAIILTSSIVGTLLPLMRLLRRDPASVLREE